MNHWGDLARVLFVGGNGHFYVARCLPAAGDPARPRIAVASDGYDRPAAERLAQRLGADEWVDDPEAAMDAFQPDLLCVGAVPGFNGRFNRLGLERGLPIITEKPAAATWGDLEALAALASRQATVLITEMPWRVYPVFLAAREAIARGAIGEVVLASAQKSYRFGNRPAWYGDRALYGGTIPWIASHAVDAVLHLTGQRLTRGWARHGNVGRGAYAEMEDHAAFFAELERGGSAAVTADYANPPAAQHHGDEWVRLAGTEGVLFVDIPAGRVRLTAGDTAAHDLPLPADPGAGESLLAAVHGEVRHGYGTAHSLTLAATLVALRDAADTGEAVDIARRLQDLGL